MNPNNKIFRTISLIGAFALAITTARAVDPPPNGGCPNQNTAEDALFSLTTGAANTAMGFDVLYSNTTGSDNPPARRNWTVTDSLRFARAIHTAMLLQNGMVLVAGGAPFHISGSAELYDPASQSWTVTGNLNNPRWENPATLLQNGKVVLVAGGVDRNFFVLKRAELGHSHR